MNKQQNFGGRPRQRKSKAGDRIHLGVLVTHAMKKRLKAAAQKTGRSQSQEAELRLEKSFWLDDLIAGGMLTGMAVQTMHATGGWLPPAPN